MNLGFVSAILIPRPNARAASLTASLPVSLGEYRSKQGTYFRGDHDPERRRLERSFRPHQWIAPISSPIARLQSVDPVRGSA
jgi:hypothetical protein